MMTRNPDACRLGIGALLQKELELTEQLETLLADEYQAIAGRDTETFERLVSDKQQQLVLLARLEQERVVMLEESGFDDGHAGMTGCLQWCDPRQQLAALWQNLLSVARICHDQNRKNQQLVELCSRHAREALHLLRGEDTHQDVYQADGETDDRHSSRSLARV
jgi:flagellar biosynthesis/type III secretory pathway chaperone